MSTSPSETATRPLTVALIGNPNTGKSTLFNALAGMNARIGNFPGVTVEKKVGRVTWEGKSVSLIDLPGTYSLSPRSLDEMVSVDVLLGRQVDVGRPDAVVCIVDASNLERNLYLVSQVLELGDPVVLVLNMSDVAKSKGVTIETETLSQKLGVPVLATQAHRRQGLDELRKAILKLAESDSKPNHEIFPAEFTAKREELRKYLAEKSSSDFPPFLLDRLMLDVGGQVEMELTEEVGPSLKEKLTSIREDLSSAGCRVPAVEAKSRYAWIREILTDVVTRPTERPATTSDKLDRFLTHRFWGVVVFCAMMFVVFQAIYTWAGPFMEYIEAGQEMIASQVQAIMAPGPFRSLLIDGIIAGVGGVLVFLPQIVFLFLFIAILEDCGYMARAAFLMDKLMTKIGLSGKSFVPLMSSFACAIPGVMATRVIENRRDRMITILIAPLMSCSARLPVYTILIAAFIPATGYLGGVLGLQGMVMFAMYSLGVLVAIPVAWILTKTFFKGETPPFVMELPSYKWPSLRIVLSRVYDRGKAFVTRAGTLIFATTIVVWALGYFPGDREELHNIQAEMEAPDTPEDRQEELAQSENQLGGKLIKESFLGQAGQLIEPAVKPLGWDWRIGVGAIASFPAREVIIATLGTIYSLGSEVDETDGGLMDEMKASRWPDGEKVYNVPVALSIMVFFALCAQCAATLMTIRRETNSWKWPLFTFTYMTALAYVAALVTYQIGMIFVS